MEKCGTPILYEHLTRIDVTERLYNEYSEFWKSLETDVIHDPITIESHQVNNIFYFHITLPENYLNQYKVRIALCKEGCFTSLKSRFQDWDKADIIDEENEYVAFVDTNYILSTAISNLSIYNNWRSIINFTKAIINQESRKNRIDYILNTI